MSLMDLFAYFGLANPVTTDKITSPLKQIVDQLDEHKDNSIAKSGYHASQAVLHSTEASKAQAVSSKLRDLLS